MKLFRPSNVYEESWFLLIVTKFFGIYPLKVFKKSRTNYIYVIILLSLYYNLFSNVHNYAVNELDALFDINATAKIRKIRYYMNVILLPIMMILCMHHSSKVKNVYEHIDDFDTSIKFLNTDINHIICMKNDIVQITTVLFIVVLFNLLDYYGLRDNNSNYMYVLMWILDRIPDFVNVVVICSFAALISKTKFRFKKINEILKTITKDKNYVPFIESSNVNNAYRLKLIKLLQMKLCKTVSLINEAYGTQFIILSILYIIYVCLHMSTIYIESDKQEYTVDVIISVLWGILDIIKLIFVIHLYRILMIQYA
ncbi:uncharacterized protein LOC143181017 [Calliopsis andreniformis]|uniref:uncharacterized protein LOC143181017 n=1 Tax=Calliopsis andreniformis TaxID=337506 RepID=UPI003FCD2316